MGRDPLVNYIQGEHLCSFVFPVLFCVFLVKPVFDLIGKEVVIKRLANWEVMVEKSSC